MPLFLKRLILLTSITAAFAGDKELSKFEVRPPASYPSHQTSDKITIGAEVIETDEQARPAFGKANPYNDGILPVLVVIQNNRPHALRVDRLMADYVAADRSRIENTPAQDLRFLKGAKQPSMSPGPVGGIRIKRKKQPLSEWEIEGRAFTAKMIPPGESASGFLYFQTGHRTGSTLYLSGLRDAVSGEELLYFEIPLAAVR